MSSSSSLLLSRLCQLCAFVFVYIVSTHLFESLLVRWCVCRLALLILVDFCVEDVFTNDYDNSELLVLVTANNDEAKS